MGDDRIRLPWEDGGDGAESPVTGGSEVSPLESAPPGPQSVQLPTAPDSQTAMVDDGVQIAQGAPAAPREVEPSPAATAWVGAPGEMAGQAVSAQERLTDRHRQSEGARSDPSIIDKVRSAVSRPGNDERDLWLEGQKPVGTYDSWLLGLRAAPGDSEQIPEIRPSSEPVAALDLDTEANGGSADLLAGPHSEVTVPRIARGRWIAIAVAVALVAIAVLAYGYAYPAVTGGRYARDLNARYQSTAELRSGIDAALTSPLPPNLASTATEMRRLADSYAPYARFISAPPPAVGAFQLSDQLDRAIALRTSLMRLNEELDSAVAQLRARSAYYETLAAIRDQMSIAAAAAVGSGIEGDDAALVLDGSVANASSFQATLASQKPPVGFETLNVAVQGYLGDFIQLGRSYTLSLKKADMTAAASKKAELAKKATEFDKILTTPVGHGLSDDRRATLEDLQATIDQQVARL